VIRFAVTDINQWVKVQ